MCQPGERSALYETTVHEPQTRLGLRRLQGEG